MPGDAGYYAHPYGRLTQGVARTQNHPISVSRSQGQPQARIRLISDCSLTRQDGILYHPYSGSELPIIIHSVNVSQRRRTRFLHTGNIIPMEENAVIKDGLALLTKLAGYGHQYPLINTNLTTRNNSLAYYRPGTAAMLSSRPCLE